MDKYIYSYLDLTLVEDEVTVRTICKLSRGLGTILSFFGGFIECSTKNILSFEIIWSIKTYLILRIYILLLIVFGWIFVFRVENISCLGNSPFSFSYYVRTPALCTTGSWTAVLCETVFSLSRDLLCTGTAFPRSWSLRYLIFISKKKIILILMETSL